MPISICHVQTTNASLYIKKLCRHFAHKIEVSFSDDFGECELPTGPAIMKATDSSLTFEVFADSIEALETGKSIIEDHFIRFSRMESISKLVWIDS